MSGDADTPCCPFCSTAVEAVEEREGWWARPCGHALGRRRYEQLRAQIDATRPPWRFDVPVAPPHVTCLRVERWNDTLWYRLCGRDAWSMRSDKGPDDDGVPLGHLLQWGRLVAVEDPRGGP